MNQYSIINIFDSLVFDARSKSINIYDIDKMIENNMLKKLLIINWNRYFILSNSKILSRVVSKINTTFSLIGSNSYDIEEMKKIVNGYKPQKVDFVFNPKKYIKLAPWIKRNNQIFSWEVNRNNMNEIINEYIRNTNDNNPKILITTNRQNGIFKSDIKNLLELNGFDKYLINTYVSYLKSKNIEPIICLSINETSELYANIDFIKSSLYNIGSSSILIIFSNNIMKNSINFKEYEDLRMIQENLNTYIYGFPFFRLGASKNDLDRFKWVIDLEAARKISLEIDNFNNNNLFYI